MTIKKIIILIVGYLLCGILFSAIVWTLVGLKGAIATLESMVLIPALVFILKNGMEFWDKHSEKPGKRVEY